METAIGSLHQAIEVLSGAGTGGDMGLLSVAAKAPLQAAGRGRMHLFFSKPCAASSGVEARRDEKKGTNEKWLSLQRGWSQPSPR